MASNRPKVEDLHLVNLTKSFGDFKAVDNLTLTIPAGSFFALLGPSGCGKTTTLRMVAGLEEPTSGQIKLGQDDITNLPPYKRWVNTVFQSYALFPHLTIYENVAFGLRRQKAKDIDNQVKAMLELVELTTKAQKKPQQLSGGQQQRVAVARALINEPDVLLLDEPLGALDLKLRRQMQLELKRIQTEVGITFVHVTHDQEEAMTMADTIAVMNEGKIEQMGSPIQIYEHPKTAFVANFLGQTNLFEGTVAGIEGDELAVKVKDVVFHQLWFASNRLLVGIQHRQIVLDHFLAKKESKEWCLLIHLTPQLDPLVSDQRIDPLKSICLCLVLLVVWIYSSPHQQNLLAMAMRIFYLDPMKDFCKHHSN